VYTYIYIYIYSAILILSPRDVYYYVPAVKGHARVLCVLRYNNYVLLIYLRAFSPSCLRSTNSNYKTISIVITLRKRYAFFATKSTFFTVHACIVRSYVLFSLTSVIAARARCNYNFFGLLCARFSYHLSQLTMYRFVDCDKLFDYYSPFIVDSVKYSFSVIFFLFFVRRIYYQSLVIGIRCTTMCKTGRHLPYTYS